MKTGLLFWIIGFLILAAVVASFSAYSIYAQKSRDALEKIAEVNNHISRFLDAIVEGQFDKAMDIERSYPANTRTKVLLQAHQTIVSARQQSRIIGIVIFVALFGGCLAVFQAVKKKSENKFRGPKLRQGNS